MKKRETLTTFTEWINHSGKITSLNNKEIAKDYYMNDSGAVCQVCSNVMYYGNDIGYEDNKYIGNYCDRCGHKQTKKRNRSLEK